MSRWKKRSPLTAAIYNEKTLQAAGWPTNVLGTYQRQLQQQMNKLTRNAARRLTTCELSRMYGAGVKNHLIGKTAHQMALAMDRGVMEDAIIPQEQWEFEQAATEALLRHEGWEKAQKLMAEGYRRTSNRHRMVSRIDRPDWAVPMSEQMFLRDLTFYYDNPIQWEDHYRRCHSKDTLTLDQYTFPHVRGSSGAVTGYIHLGEDIDASDNHE